MDLAAKAYIKGDTHDGSDKQQNKMFNQKNLHMPFPAMILLLVLQVLPHVLTTQNIKTVSRFVLPGLFSFDSFDRLCLRNCE